jgi:citrate synthase
MTLIEAPPGLRGVVAADTAIGDVRGEEGFYHYRQYSAVDLARTRTFEDAWHLLWRGRLPDPGEATDLHRAVAAARPLPPAVAGALPAVAAVARTSPLTGLRAMLSLLAAAEGFRPVHDTDPQTRAADCLRVCAVTPTILAALHRAGRGLPPVEPRPDLGTAASWLHQLTGGEPDPRRARALDRYLVTAADHGFNASTFTARVVTSTGADVAAAVTAALGAFAGPLHGGAPDRALDALDEIGSPDRADAWVRRTVAAGGRVMGFGHAVYRTADPRAVLLREVAADLGGEYPDLAAAVERRVVATLGELKPGRRLDVNVEYWAGVVMAACGIPRVLFTPTFAVSRVVGWCAHILEQAAQPRLIRPSARYTGPPAPQPVPA